MWIDSTNFQKTNDFVTNIVFGHNGVISKETQLLQISSNIMK